ncbi:GerMN domain-containing protein [Ectobacillus ponti]|uniref:GerMN domain-containing protein n=1 Tax=Ectobacillus ponti TaxID=2961894 RepID=A0AA41X6R3_9BACI|nr:GerMN domain-containing protein [Ectobacillus ponti]MCP8967350.1 GerMN domain-containing protein [Ectobacillus ponti]
MRKTALKWAAVVATGSVLLTGCGMFGQEKASETIDPPVKVSEGSKDAAQTKTKENAQADKKTEMVKRELYLMDKNGYVVPQTVELPAAQGNAYMKQALEYLVKDGPVSNLLPNGFQAVLPANTVVKGVDIKDGTAVADFSDDFKKYKKEEERKIVESITWTLTQFKGVKQVKLRINGQDVAKMPVNNTPVNGLSRADGINFDDEQVADVMNTKPVTLYFVAQNNKQVYYVPVTRRIAADTDDKVKAVIQELVKGPSHRSTLVSEFNSDARLISDPKFENGKVTLNFNENIYGSVGKNIISDHVLNSLVLSLTEQRGIEGVAIQVNGKSDLLTEKGEKLTKPVSRPQNVNTGSF